MPDLSISQKKLPSLIHREKKKWSDTIETTIEIHQIEYTRAKLVYPGSAFAIIIECDSQLVTSVVTQQHTRCF